MSSPRFIVTAVAAGLAGLIAAGTALGTTTVTRVGNAVTITGGDEVNFVEQPSFGDSGPLRYRDANGLNFGVGCVDAGNFTAECGTLTPGLVATVSLGGGDDTFQPEYAILTAPRLIVDLGAGNDTMWGSANADQINGGPGDDDINGRGANDVIDGGEGRDRLTGAGGDDTIIGGPGIDSLFGDGEFTGFSFGNDTLNAADGEQDLLSCSFGADIATADAIDTFDVLGDCEQRDIAAAPAPAPAPGPAPAPAPAPGPSAGATPIALALTTPATARLAPLAAGRPLAFRVTFGRACRAVATLVVRPAEAARLKLARKTTVIGKVRAPVPQAGTFAASLTVLKRYRPALRRVARLKVDVLVVCTDGAGAGAVTRRVTLRR